MTRHSNKRAAAVGHGSQAATWLETPRYQSMADVRFDGPRKLENAGLKVHKIARIPLLWMNVTSASKYLV